MSPYLNNITSFLAGAALLLTAILFVPALAAADSFSIVKEEQVHLFSEALDLAVSSDGLHTFVLTRNGMISIYGASGDLVQSLKAGKGFDSIEYSAAGNRLLLTGPDKKEVKILTLSMLYELDYRGSPFKGSANAKVTIAAFDDFQWPYCARLVPVLEQVLEKYPGKVKLVFKNFPLRNHKMALPAAKAALAAGNQGKFWEYHDKVFENYSKLTEEMLVQFGKDLGLDLGSFNQDRSSQEIASLINRDLREGSRIGVRGTPTIFINGKRLGQRSLEAFSAAIESELKR